MKINKLSKEYSFLTPSDLFYTLSEERQAIWRKEIENAYESGAKEMLVKVADWVDENANLYVNDVDSFKNNIIADLKNELSYTEKNELSYTEKGEKPKFEVGDVVKYKGHNYRITKFLKGGNIYVIQCTDSKMFCEFDELYHFLKMEEEENMKLVSKYIEKPPKREPKFKVGDVIVNEKGEQRTITDVIEKWGIYGIENEATMMFTEEPLWNIKNIPPHGDACKGCKGFEDTGKCYCDDCRGMKQ